jgi:hypothetical protein
MKENFQRLLYRTKANDLDEAKGIVTVAVNGIGIVDSQNDISMPGSFTKTLSENIARMKWFLNHDVTQLLGVPLEGEEKVGSLWEWRRENPIWCPQEFPPPSHDALGQIPTLMSLWIFP